MGNFSEDASASPQSACSPTTIHLHFSNRSWIDGAALDQLEKMAQLPGVKTLAAFPDLHPGKYGATGVALLSEKLHPLLIGNDIGCGMSFFELDLPTRKLKLDKAANRLRRLDTVTTDSPSVRLEELGLPDDLFPNALGTIGGGNHFCELQAVESLNTETDATPMDKQKLYLLVHSGSRSFGTDVFSNVLSSSSDDLTKGLDPLAESAVHWLDKHNQCLTWASLNRRLIAEKAASLLNADIRLVTDIPHNLVRRVKDGFVHYKGAAAVMPGELAPIAGSRATLSYIVKATSKVTCSLGGISHGAGRKYDRATMHGRIGKTRSERDQLLRNDWGGIAICDDRDLIVEEASSAYKDATQVVADLKAAGLIDSLASLRPLITYKKAIGEDRIVHHTDKPNHRREGGRKHERY
ncbi:RNA ligase RtcB family protein [Agrobacterium tumefaciens]|uniref:RNA ligase RtcB family protein n=1 Tax=Agrobacterium tumefaciens TaxID=358 RepID=UPI0021D000D1|nr:RNA ligase RtcB family protein [Agrobacterium tumefaciens]UXS04038.1 RNA ligase RtcB family protein [Agrobacterium tumefaciens]